MAKRRRRRRDDEPQQITRKEYLRQRKDTRDRQTLLAVLVPILVAVLLFVGYGLFSELYQTPREPVATVNGEDISTADFVKRVDYERWALLNNVAALSSMAQTSDPSFLQSMFGSQRDTVGDTTVSKLIDEALIRQEAASRGIDVVESDIADQIHDELATQAAPTPEPEPLDEDAEAGETDDADVDTAEDDASDAADAGDAADDDDRPASTDADADDSQDDSGAAADDEGAASDDEAAVDAESGDGDEGSLDGASGVASGDTVTETEGATVRLSDDELDEAYEDYVQPFLDQVGFGRGDYENLIRQQLFREKLSEALGAEVPITAKQVELDYIVFQSDAQEAAQRAVDEAASGTPWEAVVDEFLREETDEETDEATDEASDEASDEATDEAAADEVTDQAAGEDADEDAGEDAGEGAVDRGDEGEDAADEGTTDDDEPAGDDGAAGDVDEVATSETDDTADAGASAEITATEGLTLTQPLTETLAITEGEGVSLGQGITLTGSLTDTEGAAGASALEAITGTDGLTATEGITIGAEAAPTAIPTPEPDPFAFERGEPRWYTLQGMQDRLGLSETDGNAVLDAGAGTVVGPFSGTRGLYVIVVLDVDESRDLEGDELETRRSGAIEEWLTEARAAATIDRYSIEGKMPPEPDWFVIGWERYVQPVPTIDPNALGQPSLPEGIEVTTDDGGDAGGNSGGIEIITDEEGGDVGGDASDVGGDAGGSTP